MIKEKLTGNFSAGLEKVELNRIPNSQKDMSHAKLSYNDQLKWHIFPKSLRIEFTRVVGFEPEGIFSVVISYYVEHEVKEENSLKGISPEEMKKEICSDLGYYLQEQQGFLARMSLILANLTSSFGGVPVILPPTLPEMQDLH